MKRRITTSFLAAAMILMGATKVEAQGEKSVAFGFCIEGGYKPITLMPESGENLTLSGGYLSIPIWSQKGDWAFGGSYSVSYTQGSKRYSTILGTANSTTSLINYGVSVNAGYSMNSGNMTVTPFAGFYVDVLYYGLNKTEMGKTTTELKLKDTDDMGTNTWGAAFGIEAGIRCLFGEHIYAKFKYGYSPYSYVDKQKDQRFHLGIGYQF